jgi:hypothetical protein
MSFITGDMIQDLRDMLVDFMPTTCDIHRVTSTEGPGGSTDVDTVVGQTVCRIEEVTRLMRSVETGGRSTNEPDMSLSYPVDANVQLGDELVVVADIMGAVAVGDRFQVFSTVPLESFAVERHAWLKVVQE